jgi:hypothetical protein
MKLRIYITMLFVLSAVCLHAQLYQSAFHVGWNTLKPLSDKEFTSKTSSAGARIGFSKFMNDRFGFGIEGSYNTLDDYVPRATYEFPGGAVTTDIYNYMYYFTVMGNAQYYFVQGKNFIPYASLGMGVAFTEYRIFYNVYEETDSQTSFVVRPEIGTLFRLKEHGSFGFKTSLSYDFAANKSDYFSIDNFSGLNLLFGIVLFAD